MQQLSAGDPWYKVFDRPKHESQATSFKSRGAAFGDSGI